MCESGLHMNFFVAEKICMLPKHRRMFHEYSDGGIPVSAVNWWVKE